MSKADWERVYTDAWSQFYTPEHMATILRRAAASGVKTWSILKLLAWFSTSVSLEGVHPLQGGVLRLKHRLDRRPQLGIEPAWIFYPRSAWDTVAKAAGLLGLAWKLNRVRKRIEADPDKRAYSDQALAAVRASDVDELELFTQTDAARNAVVHAREIDRITHTHMQRVPIAGG
jgi:hypothetical protein